MSILKEKSLFNITAAQLLNDNNLFAPSVHCSYYSCLQLMKAAMLEFKGISLKDLESEITNAKNTKNLNSHSYIIKEICDLLRNDSKADHSSFERKIIQLKGNNLLFQVSSDKTKDIYNLLFVRSKVD